MLFNSYIFIFIFLPLTLLGYYLAMNLGRHRTAIVWLVAASLFFYGWYNPVYLPLIIGSTIFNFFLGIILFKQKPGTQRKLFLALGITANVMLLGYFKYANFFVDNVNALFGQNFHLNKIILPLAVSFFTIQQIAYLVDIYRNEIDKHSFLDYCFFVTFFPQLIAGPLVRFNEMMPQVMNKTLYRMNLENISAGLTVFILGLFKKVLLADQIEVYATPVFNAAVTGAFPLSLFNSWIGAFAYSFQLYFDFSGYNDMAIGLGLLFGIRLPLNFYSPYKAMSIIDFWRRWHMTLSRFVQDYLYIPFGGNRKGFPRQMINLLFVMTIAGFWHGAGWTFILWGILHGFYLVLNHGLRRFAPPYFPVFLKNTRLGTMLSIFITFILVTVAWVFFRADNVGAALEILKGMAGMSGIILPESYQAILGTLGRFLGRIGITFNAVPGFSSKPVIWVTASMAICWLLPNVQEYMSNYRTAIDIARWDTKMRHRWFRWQPSFRVVLFVATISVLSILELGQVSKFIYFNF